MSETSLPPLAVFLVGPQCSGKSTFARIVKINAPTPDVFLPGRKIRVVEHHSQKHVDP